MFLICAWVTQSMMCLHNMDSQRRIPEGQPHVSYEDQEYSKSFFLEEHFLSVHEHLFKGALDRKDGTEHVLARMLLRRLELLFQRERHLFTDSIPAFLVSRHAVSLHIPLHRLLARLALHAVQEGRTLQDVLAMGSSLLLGMHV